MNLQYEQETEDSFNPDAFGSAAPEPEPEQPQKKGGKKRLLIAAILLAVIIGTVSAIFLLKGKKEKDASKSDSGFSNKEEAVESLFQYVSERDGDGIESCFPDRSILSETEGKIVDLVITTLSDPSKSYDPETLHVSYDDTNISYLFEEDILVDYAAYEATATLDVNGTDTVYSIYLLKTDRWYILEVSGNETEEIGETPPQDDPRATVTATGEIVINGRSYALPCQYSVFRDNFETPHEEDMISAGGRNSYLLKKDGKDTNIMVTVCELMERETPARDCHVVGIYAEKDENEIVLPGGGTWGMTLDEIKNLYGEPDYTYGQEDISYKYEIGITGNEHFRECVIIFRFRDGKTVDIMQYGLY